MLRERVYVLLYPPAVLGTRALGDLDLGNWGLTNTILSTPLHHARPVDVRM